MIQYISLQRSIILYLFDQLSPLPSICASFVSVSDVNLFKHEVIFLIST